MIEDSPEGFVSRWREHAAVVELFPHTEGSPLLECRVGEALVQLFERTGPYLARPGPARVIIHPVAERVERVAEGEDDRPGVEVTGVSRIEACGKVVKVDGELLVIDAGVPLVVAALELPERDFRPGESVWFASRAPVHGFVLHDDRRASPRREEHHDDSI